MSGMQKGFYCGITMKITDYFLNKHPHDPDFQLDLLDESGQWWCFAAPDAVLARLGVAIQAEIRDADVCEDENNNKTKQGE